MRNPLVSNLLGLVGAAVGGLLGYHLFFWIVSKGFYGMMIPGALMGVGCSMLSQHRSLLRGIVVGVAALALGLFTEWKFVPFTLPQLFERSPVHLLMIALGGVFGFWMGKDASPIFPVREPFSSGSRANLE